MKKHALAMAISNALLLAPALAESTSQEEQPTQLQEIKVIGPVFSQQVGTQKISEQQIKRSPSTNGNITELLKTNPNVIFSNSSELSTNNGEIKPDEISFHGAKFYENNFMIDGISNNDNINPLGVNAGAGNERRPAGYEAYDLPGGSSQSFWVDSSLVKNIEVFDSNISAKYGNFTGGVVNAQLKDPDFEKSSGSISYSTSRSQWAKFHVQDTLENEFKTASRLNYQPEFRKDRYQLNISQPFGDNFSLLFSYNRTTSDIKFIHPVLYYANNGVSVVDTQKRLNENYLLKGVYFTDDGDQWKGTLIYSPHKSSNPKANVVNGRMSSTGGGYSGLLEWTKQFDRFKIETQLSYKQTGDTVEHAEDVYRSYYHTNSIPWVSSATQRALYGGFGKFYTEKKRYTIKQDFSATEFDLGSTSHQMMFGWSAELARAKYQRNKDIYQYTYTKANNIVCGTANECIDAEQYATSAQLYPIRNVRAKDDSYSAYFEDRIRWKRVDLNLGVRADYNQFLKNFNFAPRTSISYDLFGDQTSRMFGGFNQYYGSSMLAYALRQEIGRVIRFERDQDTEGKWKLKSTTSNTLKYRNSNLKTPYDQEWVIGFAQKIGNIDTTAKWVRRDGRNQFSREKLSTGEMVLSNRGWTKNDTFTLSLANATPFEFKYAKFNAQLNFRRSLNKSNNTTYDAQDIDDIKYIAYKERVMNARELSSPDYFSPWEVSAVLQTEFPTLNLTWDQRLKYTPKHNIIEATTNGFNCKNPAQKYQAMCGSYLGEDIDVTIYEDATRGSQITLDWRLGYQYKLSSSKSLNFTLDINNVLNSKSQIRASKNKIYYKMGRNFWAGVSYHW